MTHYYHRWDVAHSEESGDLQPMTGTLPRIFNIQPGEGRRLAVMAALLFLVIAANNLIKILRDSIFLGHHSVSELPYLYILVALCAGLFIAIYTKFTVHLSLLGLILASNAVIIFSVAAFWFLLTYLDPGWSHYAFYIWSAMASVISVSQLWTLANQIFEPDEGMRLFGLIAAGATFGGIVAGFASQMTLRYSIESNHLLWCVAGIYLIASMLLLTARRQVSGSSVRSALACREEADLRPDGNLFAHLTKSWYLKTIAWVILLSVVVSTLFDFELKTAAQAVYPSKAALAVFFSSYYGWLSVATLFAQVVLTAKTLSRFGLVSSLYLTPATLLAGALSIVVWPGLLAPALSRIADQTLRNSIHRGSMEILYLGIPGHVRRAIKTFLDVVVERVGDASAGLIILLLSLSSMASYKTYVHVVCVGLILFWIALIHKLRSGYSTTVPQATIFEASALPVDSAIIDRAKRLLSD